MPRLLALAVFSLLFWTACTQEENYNPAPAKLEALKNTYQTYLQHYKEPVVAFDLLEKLKTLAIELDNKEYLAKYYANHGYLNRMNNHFGESIKSYRLALSLYKGLQDSLKQANIATNLGNIYRLAERPSEAISYLEQAEKMYIQLDQRKDLLLVYDNISLVYLSLEEYDKAEYYISKSLEVGIILNLSFWKYNAYASYGELHFRQQRFDEAIKSFEKGLTYLDDTQQLEKAFLHGNIGESYMKAGDLPNAEKWLNEALQLKNSLTDADKRPNFNYLGELAALKGDYKTALTYYDQVVELSASDNELLSDELSTALNAIQNLGNNTYVRASGVVVPLQKYNLIRDKKDKLLEAQNKLMRSKYDQESVEKAELELARLNESEQHKEDIEQLKKETFTFQLSTFITMFLAALFCLLIIYIIRKHRKDKRTLEGYESGLQVMMDDYGVKSIAELRQILSRMEE